MEREILFRGKRKDNGKWVEGYLLKYSPIYEETTYILPLHSVCVSDIEVDPKTICQYTGLTDKNGRKIFEGDICDRKEKFPEIVMYHNGDWTLDYSYANGKESGYNYCNLGFYVENKMGVEVIGNIYDNPELLGGA